MSVEGADVQIPSTFKPFVGLFHELKVYRRALSDAEIRQSHEKEKGHRVDTECKILGE